MHWGVEYQEKALPGVRGLAKEIIEYGADLIVGHHPHWVQDWEFIDGKPVFYSLGNFVFDQMWSEKTKKGLAVVLTYESNGNLADYKLLPTYMFSWSQPEFVEEN
jgi:poly-gamma-glutamate synthesis protein (capsule biosynthesis protein)